jgi:hypothetical protein
MSTPYSGVTKNKLKSIIILLYCKVFKDMGARGLLYEKVDAGHKLVRYEQCLFNIDLFIGY